MKSACDHVRFIPTHVGNACNCGLTISRFIPTHVGNADSRSCECDCGSSPRMWGTLFNFYTKTRKVTSGDLRNFHFWPGKVPACKRGSCSTLRKMYPISLHFNQVSSLIKFSAFDLLKVEGMKSEERHQNPPGYAGLHQS